MIFYCYLFYKSRCMEIDYVRPSFFSIIIYFQVTYSGSFLDIHLFVLNSMMSCIMNLILDGISGTIFLDVHVCSLTNVSFKSCV